MLIFKGKGILIIVYFVVVLIILGIINNLIINYFKLDNPFNFESFGGLTLLVTGIWTRLTSEDFIITDSGKKVYLESDHSLFFIRMKMWGLILPLLGTALIIYGIIHTH